TPNRTDAGGVGEFVNAFHRQQITDHGNPEPVARQEINGTVRPVYGYSTQCEAIVNDLCVEAFRQTPAHRLVDCDDTLDTAAHDEITQSPPQYNTFAFLYRAYVNDYGLTEDDLSENDG